MAKQKTVVVLARIEQKNAPQSCYKVRSSEPLEIGETTEYPIHYSNGRRYAIYTVLLVNCKVVSCNCKSSGKCYHKDQCQVLEDARYADRRATLFARYLAIALVKEQLAVINEKYAAKVATSVQPEVQASPVMTVENKGTLNKQRPGWLQILPSRQKEAS